MLLLALGQSDFQLDPAAQEVEVERHQRIAGTLHLADQLADLAPMQQEFARAGRVVFIVG